MPETNKFQSKPISIGRCWFENYYEKKRFKGSQTAWNKFLKPALKLATRFTSAGVAAKTKNPQSAQFTNTFLKSLTGGRVLNLTDMHGNGLRLKVM